MKYYDAETKNYAVNLYVYMKLFFFYILVLSLGCYKYYLELNVIIISYVFLYNDNGCYLC